MATAQRDKSPQDDEGVEIQIEITDEQTNSSTACLMLQLATLLTAASVDPTRFGKSLGFSDSQVVEIDTGLEDPKSKIIHLLERYRERFASDWQTRLEEAIREKLEDPALAQEIRDAFSAVSAKQVASNIKPTSSLSQDNAKSASDKGQRLNSGHSSDWDMASGSRRSHGDTDHSSQSFERLSEENVFLMRDGEQLSKEESHHASLDHPEMSLEIERVGQALTTVSNLLGNVAGIEQLPQVIPQILQLVRKMKSQKVLREVFEEENSNLKQDLQGANEIIRELRDTIEKLEAEIEDLKRKNEDKSLKDYDYVTQKEASEIKHEEKKHEQKMTTSSTASGPAQAPASDGVAIKAYEELQKKNITLKHKLTQVVKLNHSWDEQYHRMEATLQQQIEKVKQELAERKEDWERREKERDEILVAAKHRVDGLQAELAELQKSNDQLKHQGEKVNRYAVSLQVHKKDLETEVKRLNEALEKMQVKEKPAAAAVPPPNKKSQASKAGKGRSEGELLSHEERSIQASLSHAELIDELALLKQQVDVYKSDFYKEQRDRQRAKGELDEVKTELHRAAKKMEKQKKELQILKDQALAFEFHTTERNLAPAAGTRQGRPTQRPRASPQDNIYVLQDPRAPKQYQRNRSQRDGKDLVPHGVNYAMNDEYVDARDDFEICYPPSSSYQDGLPSRDDHQFNFDH